MTFMQALVAIGVAIIGSASATLAFVQFLIKRKDEKEEKDIQSLIDDAVKAAKEEMQEKLDKVSKERSKEGAERFNKHASSTEEINCQIKANSEQIGELTSLLKTQMEKTDIVTESLAALNTVVKVSAESQKNSTYDRILVVANKVLREKRITISDKTNLKQLYQSWQQLHGKSTDYDQKIVTIYEECMKMTPIPDEEA
jgi:hypothetical protein